MPDASRLFLITPPVTDAAAFAPLLQAALDAVDIACVLLRVAAPDERAAKAIIGMLAPLAQRAGAAALVEGEARLAARLGVDGVHVTGIGEGLDEAVAALKPDGIVGVGGLAGRDAAMHAGEAGVDYLMFGGPGSPDSHAEVRAQVAWWAEIFTVPCVGYAGHPALAGDIAAAGAEFVALGEGLWNAPSTITAILGEVRRAIGRLPEPAR